MPGERGDQRPDRSRDLEPQRVRAGALAFTPGSCGSSGAVPVNVTSTVCTLEVAQLGERPLVDELARP